MFPTFEILGYTIGSYGLLAAVGCILCGLLFCYLLKKRGLMIEDGILFILMALAGVMVGGHLLYAITNLRLVPLFFKVTDFNQFVQLLALMFGGSVFYGGLFGGIVGGAIAGKILHLDIKLWADLMTPIIPLFHAIGRVGCFCAGCCYGIESEFGFITYTNESVTSINGVTRFPVQLLEACGNIILSVVLFILLSKRENSRKLKGNLIYIYLIAYGAMRFADEFLRGDLIRGFVGFLSTSQFISIISVVVSAILLYRSLSKINKEQSISVPDTASVSSDSEQPN